MHGQRSRHGYGRHEMRGGRGHGYGRHRVRRGDVRSAILALLDDRPMHGYEMIQELEERTGGRWTPSAGSIYPTLQLLEDEGLVTPEEVDGRKVYSLTDAGKEAAPERSEGGRPWEQGDEDSPRHEARKEMFKLMGAAKQLARADDEEQLNKATEILKDARRKLYGLLAEE
ncbi:MAG TPA: PadR family transcriptional regulator [Solirubrobacterales bacterium]|nr:PadR family transcriptional regulator [Solirubrobacterales bacterium]